jgi:hypothetical protein
MSNAGLILTTFKPERNPVPQALHKYVQCSFRSTSGMCVLLKLRSCYDEGKRCAETLFVDCFRQHKLE